jgi:hypothetical protein
MDLFRYDASRLDERLLAWAHETRGPAATDLDSIAAVPGFSPTSILPEYATDSRFGPVTRELQALGYWLFIGQGDPVIIHPSVGTHAKSVRIVRVHDSPDMSGKTYLSVDSTLGSSLDPLLVPVPQLSALMIGKEQGTFGECRKALHESAIACTARVNLFWPTVVSMAVLDRASLSQQS